jgi:tRNA threonylcarbamoyl adenosine modification protein YeaZ
MSAVHADRDARPWLLALDTSTATIVVAAGSTAGDVLAAGTFAGRFRHSQELLPAAIRLIDGAGLRLGDLAGIVVGTGPGAFTGLRVGIATAKTLAHELGLPIVGVASSSALLAAVDGAAALWLPAGPRDRVLVRAGEEPVVVPVAPPAAASDVASGTPVRDAAAATTGPELAVDLDGRATDAALELGRRAVAGLPAALLRIGAARLAAGEADDAERLVPRYASPPRGAVAQQAERDVAWSRDPR